jgi:Zn-dependent peptidase ImmA (M78 family)
MNPDEFGEVPVTLMSLPTGCRGFCCLGPDAEPMIVINKNLPYEMQRKTYRHEMKHIRSGEMFDPSYQEYGGAE